MTSQFIHFDPQTFFRKYNTFFKEARKFWRFWRYNILSIGKIVSGKDVALTTPAAAATTKTTTATTTTTTTSENKMQN